MKNLGIVIRKSGKVAMCLKRVSNNLSEPEVRYVPFPLVVIPLI